MAPVVGLSTTAAAPRHPGGVLVEGRGHLALQLGADGQGDVVPPVRLTSRSRRVLAGRVWGVR